jgi:hypothetical protein
MFQNLVALGWGIVVFAILIVIGSVVINKLGNAVGGDANTTAAYMNTQLGSTSGLASWTPAELLTAISGEIPTKTPEFRLKSLRGQDRPGNHKNSERETDKGCLTFSFDKEERKYNIQSELIQ